MARSRIRIGVAAALWLLAAQGVAADQKSDCEYALSSVKDAAESLRLQAETLARCAEAADRTNDCQDELRQASRAQRDYKRIIAEAKSECA